MGKAVHVVPRLAPPEPPPVSSPSFAIAAGCR